jgi:hypothetical protein
MNVNPTSSTSPFMVTVVPGQKLCYANASKEYIHDLTDPFAWRRLRVS